MKYDRKSIRLKGWNYGSAGFYFVTFCLQNRMNFLGRIYNGKMVLNQVGKMVNDKWEEIPMFYKSYSIGEFCVMPDHFHGILIKKDVGVDPSVHPGIERWIDPNDGRTQGFARTNKAEDLTISGIVQRFKMMTTKLYIEGIKEKGWPKFDKRLWQRDYFERIIRDEKEYLGIRKYILENPKRWKNN